MSENPSNPPPYTLDGAPFGPPAGGYAPQPAGGYAPQPAGGYAPQPGGNYVPLNQYPAQQAYQPPQPYPQQYLAPAPAPALALAPAPASAPAPPAATSAAPSSSTNVIVNNVSDNRPTGLCVVCGKGIMKDKPTIWTWILAILALPFGIVPGVIVFLFCCHRPTCTSCGHKE